ncbi:MAG: M1 family aminopeptidase, partial [Bacteroidota bacterium]
TTQGFFNNTLTAHELGHQWWGNNVTCASWADIWINEGFASYSEYIMLENLYQADKNQHMLDVHDNVKTQMGGSVWVLDSLNEARIFSGRLTYDKGAGIIHTIRFLINNDSLFFDGLRAFQLAYSDSTAKGVDFKNFMANHTGVNLGAFFEEWYFGEGYPTYSARWKQDGQNVLVEISHSASKPSVTPVFTNDIEIFFNRTGQADTIIRFPISSNVEFFTIPNLGTLSATSTMNIDPNNWIINNVGTVTQDNSLSINEIVKYEDLFIAPNPNNGVFTIENLTSKAEINVYDMFGKVVKKTSYEPSAPINLSDLNKGNYLLETILPSNSKRLKLVQF